MHHVSASPRSNRYGCQYDEDREEMKDRGMLLSLGLTSLQGPDGLMCLLVMIHQDELPRIQVLELIKRIHIPGYEHARLHSDRAVEEGVFTPDIRSHFYDQEDIEATLDFAEIDEE